MSPDPLILGHRGASALVPENTIAAFARAMSDGADGIEFDVRLSRDEVPVVIHDASLKRTGQVDKLIKQLTAVELQKIDVGRWFGSSSNRKPSTHLGERLPTLAQVFKLFSSIAGHLYVEMKCDPQEGPDLAAAVVRLINEREMVDRVVVESFDLGAVRDVKRFDANIRTAALFEPRLTHPISTLRRSRTVELARECGADEIALHHTLANARLIEKAKSEGFEVVVWTVDDARWIGRARSMGVKALIANNPAAMVKHRSGWEYRL